MKARHTTSAFLHRPSFRPSSKFESTSHHTNSLIHTTCTVPPTAEPTAYLEVDPFVEDGRGCLVCAGLQQGALVTEDGPVLGDDVEQAHPAHLDRLRDVVVRCRGGGGGADEVNQTGRAEVGERCR